MSLLLFFKCALILNPVCNYSFKTVRVLKVVVSNLLLNTRPTHTMKIIFNLMTVSRFRETPTKL